MLWVALGAAVGAPLRYLVDRAVQSRHGSVFPWGTLTVNVAGSLVLGFLVALPTAPAVFAVAGTGFCGALTTYSTFSYETWRLARERSHLLAAANVLVSVLAGVSAAYCGLLLAQSF
ncbi:fluoride efflux transporter CrcB [Saccharopolyspora rhizosphaerae]|uniref:Fluoride-specific ion channel FluC n=1 Tax=Saccharopolyspora rhizosphaerae TaxID=2492662 RepID=A0A3R8Q6C4_9PSEU|nr:fluoride efflux transporter CrcB [Saccharopolyspora rhizosphaerae]RRO19463.1 fluoride efflux transporter CrcB [Saccharopolyspora rhizosphaerae]